MAMLDKRHTELLLQKLEKHADKAPDFSAEELIALHAMINAWRGWQFLGRFAKWLIVALGLVAGAIASWSSITSLFRNGGSP